MHVPPPPHADGKKTLLSPKVESRVLPELTSISFSSLIKILTGPEGNNLALTPKSMATNRKIITININVLINMYVEISIIYNLIPIKLMNPRAIKPVIIKVMPKPFRGAGTFEYAIFSLIAAIATIAKNHPNPEPNP